MAVPVAPGRLPLLGHTLPMLRERHRFTASLREYGDIVRIDLGTMPTYFLTNPRLVHELLVTKGALFRKGALFDKFRPFFGNGLATSNGADHRRQRRMVQPAFHRDRIARYAETMARAAADLTASWRPGQVRAVEADAQSLAVTIVGEALFSTEMGKRAIEEIRRSIFLVLKQGMVRALSPSFVERLPLRANREFDAAIARMRAIVLDVVRSWREDGADHGDLLSMLLLAQDDETGAGMSDQQVHDEVMTLLVGGIETTALALAWTFHELARHPDVERRVHAEVDEVLSGRPPTFADVEKLVYLNRVVNEVLRMYPVWFLMRRTLAPVQLGGVPFAEGTEVIFSPHALHHDPASFAEPHRFDPDRWSPERASRVPKGAFVPFGAGGRQCVGNLFAQTEIAIAVATVAARWRLVPVPGKPVRVTFTSAAYPSGLLMTAIPRH
ncbi:cytochrome P450 [Actinokineospora fastidiosa]|uniref:Cytochrome P450 n=1 Tax=Actinokineospora fastidiosa TaxID=1816 RepID=A0A918GLZ5_9PSEU|nr:cytochrome P450 [Actinokineospora fastidiosa]GGS45898.1 cytochrome P450 [Actinokineospora fastidiosa]